MDIQEKTPTTSDPVADPLPPGVSATVLQEHDQVSDRRPPPPQENLEGGSAGTSGQPQNKEENTTHRINDQANPQHISVRVTQERTLPTLEPYQRPSMRGRGGGRRNRRPALHRAPENETFPRANIQERFTKFFTITSESGVRLSDINVIKANREIEKQLGGSPQSITETRTGFLIVEVRTREQSLNITKLKKLDTTNVIIEPHKTLNTTKGTIYYRNHPKYTPDDLLEELKRFNVSEVYQTKRRENGTLSNQPIYILSFNQCTLPPEVKIGWTKCSVRLYIPRPRRCARCQMFGHGVNGCREEQGTCYNCGGLWHELPCREPPRCPNCEENHPATSTTCFYYKLEQETLALQTKERISYSEAKRQVSSRFIRPKTTFSDIIKKPDAAPSQPKETVVPVPKPNTQQPLPPVTLVTQNTRVTKLTTGKVTLQPAHTQNTRQLDTREPASRPTELTSERHRPRVAGIGERGVRSSSAAGGTSMREDATFTSKPQNEPRQKITQDFPHQKPLVQIGAWKDGPASQEENNSSRRERKRSLVRDVRPVSEERAPKRPQVPAHKYHFKKLPPMPSNMPTTFPPITQTQDQSNPRTKSDYPPLSDDSQPTAVEHPRL